MKKFSLSILFALLICDGAAFAQRNCGFELNRASLIAKDPSWAQKLEAQKASLQGVADNYKQKRAGTEQKTTTTSAIPVIFHFMVTDSQFIKLGGVAGIAQRVDSQIAVINRDYNRQNADSALIPSGWKHLYANVGIQFALAHTNPLGLGTPGYDILIIPDLPGGFSGADLNNYSDAKHASSGGVDAWDVTKYLNIWCTTFTDYNGLLGLTTFKSETGGSGFPVDEEGICLNIGAVGKRVFATDYYIPTGYGGDHFDMGRTLTHELGHFFEIWHTWGDDGGLCPWDPPPASDDGLADTPPESNSKGGNYPDTIPGGTYYDGCRYDGAIDTQQTLRGVATHDYMNYTDDIGMFMFTTDQAAAMAAQVLVPTGENYSLTQHPELLNWSIKTSVAGVNAVHSLNIFPNPSSGRIYITFDNTTDDLQEVNVLDILGQEVLKVNANQQKDTYTIDLSGMAKGIYFIKCTFASGSITRKILLQ